MNPNCNSMTEEIPDLNIFMMCPSLNREALSDMPDEFHLRNCRRDELGIWKAMPFDTEEDAREYASYMDNFFETTYSTQEDKFFETVQFVCDAQDRPIGTCFLWKAYGQFNSIHWLKVIKGYEGLGIGRALLSEILKDVPADDYPIYLHTQPGSYRAIKLYADFGFHLLSGPQIGTRPNELEASLPILKQYMPAEAFTQLIISEAPTEFVEALKDVKTVEF